ncbi:ABC transporter substrate-binding protein [Bacillus sp. TS-2]|nr:ABC transporter substrate-binding protein [Bacillus sp. TS-2]
MKKWLLLLIALFMSIVMVACGDSDTGGEGVSDENETADSEGGTEDEAEGTEDKEDVTIRIAWWGSDPRHNYTTEVIEMYEELNPHVTIQPEYAAWDDYWQRLAPQAAANELPDIIQMDLSYISQYAENNQLADLTPFIGNQIDVSNIPDTVVSGGQVGDGIYGFNLGVNAVGFHYDPNLLESLGIDDLSPDWTWDDYQEVAQEVKDAGLWMDTGMKADVFFNYYLRTLGDSLYNEEGNGLGYDDDQKFIDFFEMTSSLVEKEIVPTPDYLAQLKGIEDDPAVVEEAIGIWQWSNQFVGFQQVADRPLKIHNMPGPNPEAGLFLKPSMFFSVSENSSVKEEAAKFIDFFVNNEEANDIILGERGVPGSSVIKDRLKPLLSEEQVQVFEYIEWAEENSTPMGDPDPIGASQIIDLLDDLAERMAYGQTVAEDAAGEFRQQAESILSQNQ